jgi:L-threonylcarbamoyladenylate synthase
MMSAEQEREIARGAEVLRNGGLVAFPTETVYGLGGDALNETAVRRIFEVKGRPVTNPLIVHVGSLRDVYTFVDLSRSFDEALVTQRLEKIGTLWPGPLSVVLPKASIVPRSVCAGSDTVAIRIPRHPIALRLLEVFGGPIAAPSANPSQYISPTTAQHVRESLGSKVDLVIDGGPCQVGLESTVLSLLEKQPKILRPGAITKEQLSALLGVDVAAQALTSDAGSPLPSPGMMSKHYSPSTKVRLWPQTESPPAVSGRIGAIRFTSSPPPFPTITCRYLSDTGDLEEIAASLFSALRDLDGMSLDVIVVDTCERSGLGEAIMDRLLRASR